MSVPWKNRVLFLIIAIFIFNISILITEVNKLKRDCNFYKIANNKLIAENVELKSENIKQERLINHYRDRVLILEDY